MATTTSWSLLCLNTLRDGDLTTSQSSMCPSWKKEQKRWFPEPTVFQALATMNRQAEKDSFHRTDAETEALQITRLNGPQSQDIQTQNCGS